MRSARVRIAAITALAGALIALCASPALAAAPPADPFPVDEPLAGSFSSDQWVLPDPGNNATAFTPTALRLTSAATGGTGNATLAQPFDSDVAFTASFDYLAFGGGNPGDAFTFFLMDADQAPGLGIGGGAAGYAGMQGAYVAVGFDNAGNFSADNSPPFNVNSPNNIVLRGAAATATEPRWPVLATAPATIQTDDVTPRHVSIEVEPSGADSILLTVTVDGAVVYDHVDVRTIAPAADPDAGIPAREQPARPARFALGFSAGTGGATNNYDISALVATAEADLSVAKSGPATVEPGTAATWTITVANDDTNPVRGASVQDAGLPAGMTDVTWTCAATGGSCPEASGTGTGPWLLDLDRGGSAEITVTGTVPDAAAGTDIVNTATVTAPADRTETATSDNTSSSTTAVLAFPDLAVSAALTSAAPLEVGATSSWDVTVENVGDGAAPGSSVVVTLPDAVDPESVVAPAGCSRADAVLTCALGDLDSGDSATIALTGTVADEAACIVGPATLSAAATTTRRELVTDNNSASVSTDCVVPVDLSIAKHADGDVTVGETLSWTITATNAAAATAPQTRIVDATLPADAVWTCTVSDGSPCSAATGTGPVDVTADIPAGGTATVVARATATATGTVSNTATVAPCDACVDTSADDDAATARAIVSAAESEGDTGDGDLAVTGGGLAPIAPFALALIAAGLLFRTIARRRARSGHVRRH